MAAVREQFLSCRQRYDQYRRSNAVPVMIDAKLQLLVSCLTKSPCRMSLQQLNPEERRDLENMDATTQMNLFTSIAGCLMGQGAPRKVKEGFIKRDRTFASWQSCYLSYDMENFYVTRKSKEIVPLTQVSISTTIKEKSGRFAFAIEINNNRFYLAFPTAEDAREISSDLTTIKRERSELLTSGRASEIMSSITTVPEESVTPVSSQQSLEPQLVSELNLENLEFDDGYKIIESFSHGRILVDQAQPNCTKLVMVLESTDLARTLELYCHPQQWNPSVDAHLIVNRLHENVYVMYEKYKAYDLTSRPRDFVFVRAAVKRGQRFFIVQKSVEHPNFPQGHSIVRGQIHERVVGFLPHPQDHRTVMMVIRMNIDFGGFNTADNSLAMAVAMLKNVTCFRDYCVQKEMLQQENLSPLYSFKQQSIDKQVKQETTLRKAKSDPHGLPQQQQQVPSVMVSKRPRLIDLMPEYETDPFTEAYHDAVVKEEQELELPLKHRYSFDVRPEEGRRHVVNGAGNFIFQNGDWRINEGGEFLFLNQRVIDAQKDVLKWMVSQVCSNLIRGKSIVNMSLPVDIFDDRSMLERNACCFGYSPIFLKQAGQIDDEVEQMRLVLVFLLSQPTLQLRQEKPFNPILGQTFQGYLGGIPICYEQISHHPPICAFYMKCPEFEMHGSIQSYAEVGLNSGTGGNSGTIHIKFPRNGTHFECITPPGEINGLIFGERRFKVIGKSFVVERSRMLFGEVSIGKDKKNVYSVDHKLTCAELAGGVFRVSADLVARFVGNKQRHKFEGVTPKDKFELLSAIHGCWNDKVMFDGRVYKSLLEPVPFMVQYEKHPLPSNCNYREDIIYKRLKDLGLSQAAKERLENKQRADKKLRSQHH